MLSKYAVKSECILNNFNLHVNVICKIKFKCILLFVSGYMEDDYNGFNGHYGNGYGGFGFGGGGGGGGSGGGFGNMGMLSYSCYMNFYILHLFFIGIIEEFFFRWLCRPNE